MTRDALRSLVEHHMETWKLRDPAALTEHHAPDGIVESPMFARRVGRPAIEAAYRSLFVTFPDWEFTVRAIVIDPPTVAVFTTTHATHVGEFMGLAGTHRRLEFSGARFMRFDAGLIVHERRIYDFTGVRVQVGVVRAKPAKP